MSEKEQFEYLLKIGYTIPEAISAIKNLPVEENTSHENSSYLNENESDGLEHVEQENTLKTAPRASQGDIEKMLSDMKEELKTLRESIHAQNRKEAVIETANNRPKTVDENVEELLKSMEVS